MYNKQIYDEWNIHIDATFHEIVYKFIEKTIKVLNTNKLRDEKSHLIDDEVTLDRWKKVQINELVLQFTTISETKLVLNQDHVLVEIFYVLADYIVLLRKNNIKINDLEQVHEPSFFKQSIHYLNLEELNQLFNILLQDISNNDFAIDNDIKFSWKIDDSVNVRNTVWNLENLCLAFNDLHKWFVSEPQTMQAKKPVLNLMLIYYMSNFYLRYINELNGGIIKYKRIYETTIASINESLNTGRPFVLITFKAIAIFLNELVKKYNFEKDDTIIKNYLLIIHTYCSEENANKLKAIIFSEIDNL